MASKTVTVAQLGCGYWGPNLLRSFSSLSDCHVKWVVEPSATRRAFVAQAAPGSQTTERFQQPLNDPDVDAVIIATPAATHFDLVKQALSAGKHVFVEKPLAMSTVEADELIDLASAKDLRLMVGHIFLYNTALRYIKKLLDDGELGDIYYIYSQRLNLGQVRQDVNVWWNLAPHDVSILLYLMNEQLPSKVSATGTDFIQEGIEDVVFANMAWSSRVMANVQVSWLDPRKVRTLTVVGSKKMVVYDDIHEHKIAVVDKGVDRVPHIGERMDFDQADSFQLLHRFGDVKLPHLKMEEPLKVEARHFIECVQTGATPITGPRHARNTVAVLEAAQQSLKNQGSTVKV